MEAATSMIWSHHLRYSLLII